MGAFEKEHFHHERHQEGAHARPKAVLDQHPLQVADELEKNFLITLFNIVIGRVPRMQPQWNQFVQQYTEVLYRFGKGSVPVYIDQHGEIAPTVSSINDKVLYCFYLLKTIDDHVQMHPDDTSIPPKWHLQLATLLQGSFDGRRNTHIYQQMIDDNIRTWVDRCTAELRGKNQGQRVALRHSLVK